MSITRRRFLYAAATTAAAAVAGDSLLFEPNRPVVRRKDFAITRWPERLNGFTIAQISDFHYDPVFSTHPLHAAIPMVRSLQPDMIVLTGDFVSVPDFGTSAEGALAADPCSAVLRRLTAPLGMWAILGNHDCDTDPAYVTHALQSRGIPVLVNQSVAIERDGTRFWLAGVNDALTGTPDLTETLRKVPSNEPIILLAHEPDFADYASRFPIDLQLSGHSHGGQVRLPFLPPLYLPDMAKKYFMGAYQVGPLPLYTNAGLGTITLPVRLNCPPEITLLTLRSSKA
jgi:predicted MPP superfamily phosphohydrolase